MFTNYYRPHPALSEFVETICIMSHDFTLSNQFSSIQTFVPTHTRFICFNLEDSVKVKRGSGDFEARELSIITGPQLGTVTLDLGKKHEAVVVVLKPCGLFRLLGIPIKDLVDCDFDARLVIGNEINELLERLMNFKDNNQRNQIIQSYLLSNLMKLKPALPIDIAMLILVKSQGKLSMDYLASQSCLSNRQLERRSLERIGLSPKCFARMIRFSEAHNYKEQHPHTPWTEIAHRFGYYDQMHLIRDFREFTGVTPSMINRDGILNSSRLNSTELNA